MRSLIAISSSLILFALMVNAQNIQHLDQRGTSYQMQEERAPTKTQGLILKGYDLALSGLSQDAKKMLIDAIYDSTYGGDEPYLRFALGQVCYASKEYEGAKYQWNIIYTKYPQSEEAEAVKIIFSILGWLFEDWSMDQKFNQEYELSSLFWKPTIPDPRMNPEELVDPIMAINYLQELYNRYTDETKRAVILYDQFMLFMGYNDNGFGYFHATEGSDDSRSMKYYKAMKVAKGESNDLALNLNKNLQEQIKSQQQDAKSYFLSLSIALSESLGKLSVGKPYYVRTQFLIGVSFCGSKLFSSNLKMKKDAVPYFQHVIDATEGEETNLYRIFTMKWLSDVKRIN